MEGQKTDKQSRLLKSADVGAHLIFWPVVIFGIIADLWSKSAVFKWLAQLDNGEFVVVDGLCKFVMRLNDGAAFSIASGQRIILVSISIIALIAVIGIFLFGSDRRKIMLIALALFLAGIVGNLYDRIFNDGFVRDFIDIYRGNWHWPAFNIADSMLCTAVGLMLITSFTAASSQKPVHQQKQEPQDPN
jgi:signal peptidase II